MYAGGFEINQMDYDKRTGLHLAASEGHAEIVKFLLENGADQRLKDRFNNIALSDAIRENHKDVVEIL
jgi:glutaminase